MIGETLAHYKIVEKIGEGGMGEVYVAEDTKLKRRVALKLLPESMAADEERLQRFQREAEAIAALNHPNIVTIYSVEEDQGHHFLTMELVKGVDLGDKIPAQGMNLEQIFTVAIPSAEALAAAHEEGVVHRDLKPANIMVGDGERVKILDFGLAKLAGGAMSGSSNTHLATESITQEGRILGTVAYMSPEQAEGKPIDGRSDIFSLGVVLYQMATGDQPFTGDTNLSTLSSILKETPDSVTDLRTNLPRHLGRIITHCLEKDPKRRYQSAQDVVNELTALKSEIDSGKTPSDMSLPAMEAPKKRPAWMPFAIGAGLLLAVIIGWLAIRGNDPATPAADLSASNETEKSTTPTGSAPRVATAASDRLMAVVLPFKNLGAAEDAYFAAGITEEITNRLSSVGSLGVISSQSAQRYEGSVKTPKEIGAELGVDYILGGSVRWAQNPEGSSRIRISPQLVRVSDDTQVWSESYDRVIDDIFTVQSEIAESVVEALGVNLLDTERQTLASVPTENTDAYQAYLQGVELYRNLGDNSEVAEMFERAVELDPGFAQAWAQLSSVKSQVYFNRGSDPNLLTDSKKALDRALELAPEDPLVRLASGYYHYYGFSEFDRALEEFEAVAERFPNNPEAIESVGYIYRRQGRFEESIRQLERAMELDPRSTQLLKQQADTYSALRRFDQAYETLDRIIELAPSESGPYELKAAWLTDQTGSTEAAREVLANAETADPMTGSWMTVEYLDRNFDRALELSEALPTEDAIEVINALYWQGSILRALGRNQEAGASLESAASQLEALIASRPDAYHGFLAFIYSEMGRKSDAIREARRAARERETDRFSGPTTEDDLAWILAMNGEHEEAIEIFDRLFDTQYYGAVTVGELRLSPNLDAIREDPRFQEMLARHE